MSASRSAFDTWYTAQFGPRPWRHKSLVRLSEEMSLAIRLANRAEAAWRQANNWESARNAALKAWCARDKRA